MGHSENANALVRSFVGYATSFVLSFVGDLDNQTTRHARDGASPSRDLVFCLAAAEHKRRNGVVTRGNAFVAAAAAASVSLSVATAAANNGLFKYPIATKLYAVVLVSA